jgi:hypothetical protein
VAKEKKELKALQVAEEKEYQRKLQEKVDRDNGELQWQYDQERGICNCSHKEKHKEKIAEMDNRREKVRSKTPRVTIFTCCTHSTCKMYYSHRTTTTKKKKKIQIN